MNAIIWKILHPHQAKMGRDYHKMVNAPLRPETIAAIAKSIQDGTMPRRKVVRRK